MSKQNENTDFITFVIESVILSAKVQIVTMIITMLTRIASKTPCEIVTLYIVTLACRK